MDFVIDTKGNVNNDVDFVMDTDGNEETENLEGRADFTIDKKGSSAQPGNKFVEELFKDFDDILEKPNAKKPEKKVDAKNSLVSEVLSDLGLNKNGTLKKRRAARSKLLNKDDRKELQKALAKSVITPEFEKLHVVPPLDISQKKLKLQRRKERDLTKGKKWFGMPATELTDEIKRDLEVLQMRSVLDPKHFYKKNDLKVLPKYFQIGKVMDSPLDFYNNRIPMKQRKKTLVDELLADAEFQKYNKRKYKEIIEEKQKTHYKAWRQAKRLKKRK